MKLVMTLCVKNETDILRENIEFHLNSGVDFIIATDNRSDDNTQSILRAYQDEGVLKYIYDPSPFCNQHEVVTNMARMAAQDYQADWVLNNDADEFWWTPDADLKGTILRYSEQSGGDALFVNRQDFVSHPEDLDPDTLFYERMNRKKIDSMNAHGELLPPKLVHKSDPLVKVITGNHDAFGERLVNKEHMPEEQMVIFHFPLRSYQHLVRKAIKDYSALRKNILMYGVSSTYLEYNQMYKDGSLIDYYRDHCGPDTNDETVLLQHGFCLENSLRDRLSRIMQAPLVNVSRINGMPISISEKLAKAVLDGTAMFFHTSYYYWTVLKRKIRPPIK